MNSPKLNIRFSCTLGIGSDIFKSLSLNKAPDSPIAPGHYRQLNKMKMSTPLFS